MLVLVAMAVILLVALEQSSRLLREIRVATLRASAEQAFYVAEAGFNKIRAEIIVTGAPEEKYLDPAAPQTEFFKDNNGDVVGNYTLYVTQTVEGTKTAFEVVSDAVLSSRAARRTVSGTIIVGDITKITLPGSTAKVDVWRTNTKFVP